MSKAERFTTKHYLFLEKDLHIKIGSVLEIT